MRKEGLYYGPKEDTFVSKETIKKEMAMRGELPDLAFSSEIKYPVDIDRHLHLAQTRADQMKELSPRAENFVELTLPNASIVNIMADMHFGHPDVNIERIRQELEIIRNTPDSLIIFNGDLLDGIFWGGESGGEQSANLNEQRGFLTSLFSSLRGKIIVATSGEHDSKWASRSGGDPYSEFSERANAPYVRGVAEVLIHVGEQDYKIVTQHRARGSSIYNKNHPTFREARFDLQDADVYISSHTHTKQISQETIRKFGKADIITHVSTGPYKTGDGYGQRMGYPEQKEKEMFGAAIKLNKDRKLVEVDYSIVEAHNRWA